MNAQTDTKKASLDEARAIYERGINAGQQFSIVNEIATALAAKDAELSEMRRELMLRAFTNDEVEMIRSEAHELREAMTLPRDTGEKYDEDGKIIVDTRQCDVR